MGDFLRELFFRAQALVAIPIVRVLLRMKVHGPHIQPGPNGLIVAPNHLSWIDPLIIQIAVYPHRITFLMTELFFDRPVIGLYFRAIGARPIREDGPSVGALRASMQALRDGDVLCVFPEGSITPDGKPQKGQRGAARLARKTGATVIPAGIRGTLQVISRVHRRPRLHPVAVELGEPMLFDKTPDRAGEVEFTEDLMARIGELS
ncbi:MAG: lysophospholipid acyltransferase family protein [Planctomycetota bacterium]